MHQILATLDPVDVFRFSLSSKAARGYCVGNAPLAKALFLRLFDPPTTLHHDADYDYERNLHARILARSCITGADEDDTLLRERYIPAITTLIEVATAPATHVASHSPSKNCQFLTTLFQLAEMRLNPQASLEDAADEPPPHQRWFLRTHYKSRIPFSVQTLVTARKEQLAAQLTLLRGPVRIQSTSALAQHRAVVYDRKNVTRSSLWGPFCTDGTGRDDGSAKVDFIKLEAVAQVMYRTVDAVVDVEWRGIAQCPTGWDSTRPSRIPSKHSFALPS